MNATPVLEIVGSGIERLPEDMRSWLSEAELVQLAVEASELIGGRGLSSSGLRGNASDAARQGMMLTLLTYCYLVGHWGSEEVEWAARNDPVVRGICNQTCVDMMAVRQFRRTNHRQIEQCLVHVLMIAIVRRIAPPNNGVPCAATPAETYATAVSWARRKIDLAIMMDAAASD